MLSATRSSLRPLASAVSCGTLGQLWSKLPATFCSSTFVSLGTMALMQVVMSSMFWWLMSPHSFVLCGPPTQFTYGSAMLASVLALALSRAHIGSSKPRYRRLSNQIVPSDDDLVSSSLVA